MAKPKPPPLLLLRLLSAAMVLGMVLLLLTMGESVQHKLEQFIAEWQMSPYTAALSSGDVKHARAVFDREIRANPTEPAVYALIAEACMQANHNDLASEYLERGVTACKDASRPQRAQLYMLLATAYSDLEKTKPQQRAILAAQRAAELDPDSPQILNEYGYLLADNDQLLNEAVAATSKALQLLKKEPNDPQTQLLTSMVEDSYGWALYKQGRYDAAVSALQQAIADVPPEIAADTKANGGMLSELYFHLGAASRRQKRPEIAKQALETAISLSPNNKNIKDELDGLNGDAPGSESNTAKPPVSSRPAGKPGPPATIGSAATSGSSANGAMKQP